VGFGNVDQEKILHRGIADLAIAIAIGEVGDGAELRRSDASAKDGGADGKEAGLLLRDDAEMIAVDVRGKEFGFGGIEFVTEAEFHGGEEGLGGPAVFEEKELEARLFAGLPEDFAVAEDFGDRANDGDDLVREDEGVEAEGEVGMGREAAADTQGKAKFVIRGGGFLTA
jgi:hypothetical protein